MSLSTETILDPANFRVNIYPIIYEDIWQFYKSAQSSFWVPEEIDMRSDVPDWKDKLDDKEKFFIKQVLTFFAGSDFIVNENLGTDFCERITIPEFQFFYRFQEMIEDIHSITYNKLIDTYITDEREKAEIFKDIYNKPGIIEKTKWAKKWIRSDISFVERLIAFAMVEGIFFSGSFCAIFWLKKSNRMLGLCQSNKLISRDEGMHMDFACMVYSKYIHNKLPEEQIINMLKEAVEVEKTFVKISIPVEMIGMNSNMMCTYIEFVADHLLYKLINKKIYNSDNPFPWMNLIGMENKENFFEHQVTNYAIQKAITDSSENSIRFDCDF